MLFGILFFILLFCCGIRTIRYFWKFPMPAIMGNVIAAGPYRGRVQPPRMIVDALQCRPGMKIVEMGCGSGFYTVAVAKAIQSNGILYAVDIQEGMLEKLKHRMESEGVQNVTPILADAEGKIPLDDGIADAVFSIAVVPEIPDPVKALREISRLMTRDGIFVDSEVIMDPDYPRRSTVIKWANRAGLVLERQSGNIFHYALVFKKGISQEI
jgi:ubiquinone/menaquinone biosynthesis C-methylase UbiE